MTIPLTPPSVNHYKLPIQRTNSNGDLYIDFVLTGEAKVYQDAVALIAQGRTVSPDTDQLRKRVRYALYVVVYLGKNERGDGDNFWKCVADSLVKAGVIHSDARVKRWCLDVEDIDRENPRTEIIASVLEYKEK